MRGRRIALYVGLALLVPASAFALGGGGDPSGGLPRAGQLGVTVSVKGCGILQDAVVCRLDAGFNQVDGATSYTASVTRPDGSVVDYGEISPDGSAGFWVPYVGNGTYTVNISAYGRVGGDTGPDLIAKGGSGTGHGSAGAPGGGAGPRGGDPSAYGNGEGNDPNPAGGGDQRVPPDPPPCDEQAERYVGDGDLARASRGQDALTPQSIDCPDPPPGDGDGTDGSGDGDPGSGTDPGPGTPPEEPPPAP